MSKDIYKPEGIFNVTGEIDAGKTLFSLGSYPIKDTVYIYDDVKKFSVEGIDVSKEFGLFINLTEKYPITKYKELEFAKAVMAEIDAIPSDKYSAIVFDTWTRFGKALRRYAKANPLLFREKEAFTNQVAIRNAEEWGEANIVEANYIASLSHKCKALFLNTHIRNIQKGQIKTDALEPDCGSSFKFVCNARFWLRHNKNSGVPIVLVMKRLAKVQVKDGMIQPVNLLPRKITPMQDEKSVWDCINRYWQNPVGNREPTEDEIPSPFELSILDGVLTDDQKEMWRAELDAGRQREKEENEIAFGQFEDAKKLTLELAQGFNGMPAPMVIPQIIAKVQEQYPNITEKDLSEMLKGA